MRSLYNPVAVKMDAGSAVQEDETGKGTTFSRAIKCIEKRSGL
jgi:hypothetical protein